MQLFFSLYENRALLICQQIKMYLIVSDGRIPYIHRKAKLLSFKTTHI